MCRSLIALLFVVAGIAKLTDFSGTVATVREVGIPLAPLVVLMVIIIEIPVAIAFALGYRVCATGWTLIVFTALATILMHGNLQGLNLVMALKNLAIIGGILLAVNECVCGVCPPSKKKRAHHEGSGE